MLKACGIHVHLISLLISCHYFLAQVLFFHLICWSEELGTEYTDVWSKMQAEFFINAFGDIWVRDQVTAHRISKLIVWRCETTTLISTSSAEKFCTTSALLLLQSLAIVLLRSKETSLAQNLTMKTKTGLLKIYLCLLETC